MATPRITYDNKVTYSGSGPKLPVNELAASEANQIKDVTNAIGIDHDALVASKGQPDGLAVLGSDGKIPISQIPAPIYKTFSTYALMKTFLQGIGTTTDAYQIVVIADEQNNNGNLTNYTYTNGILNWVATTPIAL